MTKVNLRIIAANLSKEITPELKFKDYSSELREK